MRRRGPQRLELHDAFDDDALGFADDPEALLLQLESRKLRWQAFGRLPAPVQALLLAVADADDQVTRAATYADLAESLDVPAGTLRVRIHRARTALRRQLAALLGAVLGAVHIRRHLARHGTATAAVPMLVASVMTLTVALPPGGFPLGPQSAQAQPAAPVDHSDRHRPPPAPTPQESAAPPGESPAAAHIATPRPPGGDPRPPVTVRVCVPDTAEPGDNPEGQGRCASTAEDEPGDEVCVKLPGDIGRPCRRQNIVPACDVVPDNDIVDCERYGDPNYWPVRPSPPSEQPRAPGLIS